MVATASLIASPLPEAMAGTITGQATEWTQLLNNAELIALTGQSGEQIQNQITQITQLAEQIQNQLNIYANMLQNTAQLPTRIWGQVERDLNQLRGIVGQGQGIAFSMGNLDDILRARFQSFAELRSGLADGESFSSHYQSWSDTNRETISASLRAAGLTASQFHTEEATMTQLRVSSESADGQLKALQVGHEIATQQVAQAQKLRGLVAQQVTMLGTWLQSEQVSRDLSQTRREEFFNSTPPSTSGGQTMAPRW
ncbi:P-type conjugative transfer protein TrbJ [Neoaquamicrobium microcysteis]|nr:P-type conjugative transfer protein TrbJ [Mesorhizobium microcysteis]